MMLFSRLLCFSFLVSACSCSSSSFDVAAPPDDSAVDGSTDDGSSSVDCTKASDGTVCGDSPRSICRAGTCRASTCGDGYPDLAAGEECDDGNAVKGDGCDDDCAFSCDSSKVSGKTCDDGKACNGRETCSEHACAPGTARTCGSDNACSKSVCVEPSGDCTTSLIDDDKDGQASKTLGTCGTDCDDTDPLSFKGQSKYFITAAKRGGFDYDCDGVETKQFNAFVSCGYDMAGNCIMNNEGWFYTGGTTPACGATADWIPECFVNGSNACVPRPASTVKKTQGCR